MKKGKIGYFIIASAIVWGAVIIACASALKGTPYKADINNILIGGSTIHLLFIWGPLGALFRTQKEKPEKDSEQK